MKEARNRAPIFVIRVQFMDQF